MALAFKRPSLSSSVLCSYFNYETARHEKQLIYLERMMGLRTLINPLTGSIEDNKSMDAYSAMQALKYAILIPGNNCKFKDLFGKTYTMEQRVKINVNLVYLAQMLISFEQITLLSVFFAHKGVSENGIINLISSYLPLREIKRFEDTSFDAAYAFTEHKKWRIGGKYWNKSTYNQKKAQSDFALMTGKLKQKVTAPS